MVLPPSLVNTHAVKKSEHSARITATRAGRKQVLLGSHQLAKATDLAPNAHPAAAVAQVAAAGVPPPPPTSAATNGPRVPSRAHAQAEDEAGGEEGEGLREILT